MSVEETSVKLSHFIKLYPMVSGYIREWMWNQCEKILGFVWCLH